MALMTRRHLAVAFGSAAAWASAARGQQPRIQRVGVLMDGSEANPEYAARVAAFRQSLQDLGWVEDRNIRLDIRFAVGSIDLAQVLAKELVALQPSAILVSGTGMTNAVRRETSTIPIVFTNVSDPVGSGFVANLARPNGNLTGFLNVEASIVGKWLSMLKEIEPELAHAAVVANPATTPFDYFARAAETVASSLAIEIAPSRVASAADVVHVIETFAATPKGGLVFPPDAFTSVQRDLIIALAARHRLPAVYGNGAFVPAGGLMAYDNDRIDMHRRAANYVDRILRGAQPADLPVQAPVKYQTSINLKTAKALGLTVPPALLVAADEVIE